MNKKKDILLETPCPELLCGLCTDILNDPMQVHCSEDHMFCRTCLANYNKESCPSCLEPLDKTSFQLSKFVKRQISRLRARCIYHSLGCPWEGLLEDCHSQSCHYQSIHCPNSHRGCTELIKLLDMDQHRTQCPYELIACPNSSKQCQPYLRKDNTHHDSTCSSFRCLFSQQGCPFVGTLQAVGRHCEEYCGKIHERIRQLELQCNYMKQQLEQIEPPPPQQQQQQQPQQYPDAKNIVENIMNDTKSPTSQDTFMDSSTDPSMDEMALFHQMFNNNYLSVPVAATENNAKNTYSNHPTIMSDDDNRNMMDLSSPMSSIPLLTNSEIQQPSPLNNKDDTGLSSLPTITSETTQAPHPPSHSPPTPTPPPPPASTSSISSVATAPKRSTNGKIIRYSKNKQLAHGALRMSRQRSTSGSSLTTEAILHALHIASKSNQDEDINMVSSSELPPVTMSASLPTYSNTPTMTNNNNGTITTEPIYTSNRRQSSSSSSKSISSPSLIHSSTTTTPGNNNNHQPSYSFKNLDDVTKFLEELPPIVEGSPFLSPSHHHGRKSGTTKSKGNINSDRSGKSKSTSDKRQQKMSTNNKTTMEIPNSKNDDDTPTTPNRPMYVLASTLLSKHSHGH